MTSTGQLVPMNAAQQWLASKRRPRIYWPDIQTRAEYPLKNVQVTRPIAPWGPSFNTNEIPFRGWNESGLNTYPIPRHDKIQLGLFNRFVLHNPEKLPDQAAQNGLLRRAAKNMAQRGLLNRDGSDIIGRAERGTTETRGGNATLPLPLRYRYGFGGMNNMGTQSMGTGGAGIDSGSSRSSVTEF
jgi:hypothetical protein